MAERMLYHTFKIKKQEFTDNKSIGLHFIYSSKEKRIIITEVEPNSPPSLAGLMREDIIVQVNKQSFGQGNSSIDLIMKELNEWQIPKSMY